MYRQHQGVNETDTSTGEGRVDYYEELLNERWRQLQADRNYYEHKLRDSAELDPDDRTGLRRIFQAHIDHIANLMAAIDSGR
ncbi:MAG: hypothetical protein HKO62_11380 [Gammaproteobacteria bacterium]|nr:hypothetical protein [Gammaproteobacteria bacterium]